MAKENLQKEEYDYTCDDIARYRSIALMPELLEQNDQGGLEETVTSFVEGLGAKLKQDNEGITSSILASQQSLQNFMSNFGDKYQKALGSSTLKDLRGLYSDSFEKFYDAGNLGKVNQLFASDRTYGDFIMEYQTVAEKAQSKTGNFSDEQKKQAKEQMNELNKIMLPLSEFEKIELSKLKDPIDGNSLKKKLNSMYEQAEKSE